MSDIVESLRNLPSDMAEPTARELAADEIERLRARVKELEYWNGAVAVCEEHVQDIVALDPKLCVICDEERLRAALREIIEKWDGHLNISEERYDPRAGEQLASVFVDIARRHLGRTP